MIIGTRMTGRKRQVAFAYGGERLRFVEVWHHALHATKGWRLAKHFRTFIADSRQWLKIPQREAYFKPAANWKSSRTLISDAGRWMRGRDVIPLHPNQIDLLAHGWYRRKMLLGMTDGLL